MSKEAPDQAPVESGPVTGEPVGNPGAMLGHSTVGPDFPGVTGAPGEGTVDTDRLEAEQAEDDDEDADDDE